MAGMITKIAVAGSKIAGVFVAKMAGMITKIAVAGSKIAGVTGR